MRSALVLGVLGWLVPAVCEALPSQNEPCNGGSGTCRTRDLCDGGLSAKRWWTGHCQGIFYCCFNGNDGAGGNGRSSGRGGVARGGTVLSALSGIPQVSSAVPIGDLSDAFSTGAGSFNSRSFSTKQWKNLMGRLDAELTKTSLYQSNINGNRWIVDWIEQLEGIDRSKPLSFWVNRVYSMSSGIRYQKDSITYTLSDFWATPKETADWFLKKGSARGDCEDYAIFSYVSLRLLGVPPQSMRLVVVAAPEGAHAILAVRVSEDEILIVDNQRRFAVPLSTASYPPSEYRLHYSVSEEGYYLHSRGLINKYRNLDGDGDSDVLASETEVEAQVAARFPFAERATETVLASYLIGRGEGSLPAARLDGAQKDGMRDDLIPVWRTDAFDAAATYIARRCAQHISTDEAPVPVVAEDKVDGLSRALADIERAAGPSYEGAFADVGPDGVLVAAFMKMVTEIEVANARDTASK